MYAPRGTTTGAASRKTARWGRRNWWNGQYRRGGGVRNNTPKIQGCLQILSTSKASILGTIATCEFGAFSVADFIRIGCDFVIHWNWVIASCCVISICKITTLSILDALDWMQ
jgi:hypothetical protein